MKHLRFIIPLFALGILSFFIRNSVIAPLFPNQSRVNPNSINSAIYDNNNEKGIFHGITAFSYQIPTLPLAMRVLGESTEEKHIEIDLSNQRLYAFQGSNKVFDFPISSGLNDWTPRGKFQIWLKLRYTHMNGGSILAGTYYDLPNVPFTMFFSNADSAPSQGFSIHGTYWHNNFGQPTSHGSIDLRIPDAEQLFYWTKPDLREQNTIRTTTDNPGTRIVIYGKYEGK
jgi:lipoprotein-anchoring transpeptidase ErfK/SrfK